MGFLYLITDSISSLLANLKAGKPNFSASISSAAINF
jgi:hypothetical protein